MRDLSFLSLIKKSMGAKLRKRFKNFCNSDTCTSTLNQSKKGNPTDLDSNTTSFPLDLPCSPGPWTDATTTNNDNTPARKSVTLEEMILQLDHEEEMARIATSSNNNNHKYAAALNSSSTLYHHYSHHQDPNDMMSVNNLIINHDRRMSCVNNSEILRSARNAVLNQYPRFSLDGKDSMYRSSFTNHDYLKAGGIAGPRKSSSSCMAASGDDRLDLNLGKLLKLPQSVGGESVIWCKPSVIAKLMGLDVMPLPINSNQNTSNYNYYNDRSRVCRDKLCAAMKNQNLRRRAERHEIERRRYLMDLNGCINNARARRGTTSTDTVCSSSSRSRYYVMKPIVSMDRPAAATR